MGNGISGHALIASVMVLLSRPMALAAGAEAGADEERATAPGTGTIRGTILNAESHQPIAGARLRVTDSGLEAETGSDGRYALEEVPVGRHEVTAEAEGFAIRNSTVEVQEDRSSDLDFVLAPPEPERPEEIVVQAPRPTIGDRTTMIIRKTAAGGTVAIDTNTMKKRTESDAAQAAGKLTGVQTVDGKYVYVRGLGDRYSQTLLNGSNLPSPEPDKRVIPLDLFPVNLLDSISIAKTYSPDMPGEFAGGSVLLKTKDIPEEDFMVGSLETKYRYETSLRDFKTYHGGNLDMFGYDDGTRKLPGEVPNAHVSQGANGLTPEDVQDIGRSFPDIWEPDTATAPLDTKLALAGGKRYGQPGASSLGIIGALNWGNKYQTILDETRRIVNKPGKDLVVVNDFTLDSWTHQSDVSGILSLTWEINEGQKVGWRNLYSHSASDEVRTQSGIDSNLSRPTFFNRLRWVDRGLFTTQPFGEHLMGADTLLEWRASYSLSQRDEPDNRQVQYWQVASPTDPFEVKTDSPRRNFFELDENIYNLEADYSIPWHPFGIPDRNPLSKVPEQKIKFGPSFLYRDRSFDSRRFSFGSRVSDPVDDHGRPIDLTGSADDVLKDPNINPNGFVMDEQTQSSDNYDATQAIIAGYGLVDVRFHEDWRIQAGARVENSDQELQTTDRFPLDAQHPAVLPKTKLESTDVMPAMNLIWEFYKSPPINAPVDPRHPEKGTGWGDFQLRLGASQTVSRPEFRELAQFNYTDVEGGYNVIGNPELKRAKITNADASVEWFPTPNDILTLGVFYKYFDQPIETVQTPASSTFFTTWMNADSAQLVGGEVEARKSLGFLDPGSPPPVKKEPAPAGGPESKERAAKPKADISLNDFSVIANFAYIDSETRIPAEGTVNNLKIIQTNNRRPLQGQAKYLFNAGFLFDSERMGMSAGIFTSTFGNRLSAVGVSGVPDEYEQPRWDLNAKFSKTFGRWVLTVTGENLLNDKYEYKTGDIVTRDYRRGFVIGMSLAYNF